MSAGGCTSVQSIKMMARNNILKILITCEANKMLNSSVKNGSKTLIADSCNLPFRNGKAALYLAYSFFLNPFSSISNILNAISLFWKQVETPSYTVYLSFQPFLW